MKQRGRSSKFDIVYEDRDLIVVNKSAGILAVPLRTGESANVFGLLKGYLAKKKERPQIVHRIDRYTSGLLVFAKHQRAREQLIRQFMRHTPAREYLALVRGVVTPPSGELVHYLKLGKDGFRQEVFPREMNGAEKARLLYKVVETSKCVSLVAISLDTGLKNQIRVQFAEIRHPVVGDQHYSEREADIGDLDHQALHAGFLELEHPRTRRLMKFTAPLPKDIVRLMQKYGLMHQAAFPYISGSDYPCGKSR